MTRQRRDPWFEIELRDDPDDVRVLFRPGWTNDTEGIFLPLRETGWFATTYETRQALERMVLTWGWIGVDDDLNLVECSAEGRGARYRGVCRRRRTGHPCPFYGR